MLLTLQTPGCVGEREGMFWVHGMAQTKGVTDDNIYLQVLITSCILPKARAAEIIMQAGEIVGASWLCAASKPHMMLVYALCWGLHIAAVLMLVLQALCQLAPTA